MLIKKGRGQWDETAIVRAISEGKTIKEISITSGEKKKTVEAKVVCIQRKYNCVSISQLVAVFVRKEII